MVSNCGRPHWNVSEGVGASCIFCLRAVVNGLLDCISPPQVNEYKDFPALAQGCTGACRAAPFWSGPRLAEWPAAGHLQRFADVGEAGLRDKAAS